MIGTAYPQTKKRNVFFSFHYADVMRVNNVRNSGEFKQAASDGGRSIEGFYDYSLWESRRLNGEDGLKRLIREGVQNTSVVCVLIGSKTWQRPWVRYEIARSVVDQKGLLAVHINGIRHHQPPYTTDDLGDNPCRYLGLAARDDGRFYLCERKQVNGEYKWKWYDKHTAAVPLPSYMEPPQVGHPVRLSEVTSVYDWSRNGHASIGGWIDTAAQVAGR